MDSALVVGGTRFVGRHAVEELLAHGYAVTLLTRGRHENPFAENPDVAHVQGDRNERAALEEARDAADPDLVVDVVAYFPEQVRTAVDVFADVGGYVYVSSASAYAGDDVPMREDETELHGCTDEQATEDAPETYGPRKAEGDRVVAAAAEEGANAVAVRPMLVYGPHDYTERFDYWLARLDGHDRVLVPGDGDSLLHGAYVEDVAAGIRVAGEHGTPGEAYNVADRNARSLDATLELAAEALDREVELVHASARDLAAADLEPTDFPHFSPRPALAATGKLHDLGWASTPPAEAMARTVAEHRESDRDGADAGPDREATRAVLDELD